jgi:hypothetical protein
VAVLFRDPDLNYRNDEGEEMVIQYGMCKLLDSNDKYSVAKFI